MCGILGIISSNPAEDIKVGFKAIAHRGPDGEGIFSDNNIALAHKRLSIIDLSLNGHQPMYSNDGQFVIIFNGEIYNHLEIRKNLENKYCFRSMSDTETLLYGFIEYGTEVLNMLNGIFAFAIYDIVNEDLLIVRDHFGVKPLYYYLKDDTLIFGSEIKSFLSVPNFDKSINYNGLVNYLTFLWSPGEITAFKEVKKLLPGHYLKVKSNNLSTTKITKYYDIPFTGVYSSAPEQELMDILEQKLFKAVERQLLADVPVAFFLSGGLDSSAIVAMAKKIRPHERLRCYTIVNSDCVNDDGFSNDLYYARLVANQLDLDLVEVEANIDIISSFDKMIYHLDEPQADAAPLHVLNICMRARKDGYTVLLGGTAGDDLFSGYRRHQALNYEKYFRFIHPTAGRLLKTFSAFLSTKRVLFRRVRKLVANIDLSAIERMYGFFEWVPLVLTKGLFSIQALNEIREYEPKKFFFKLLKNIPQEKNSLNQLLYWEMKSFLVDHNLNYTDKLSMASGVEVRVPFLDIELVDFSTKIPPELKMKGKETKYLLKKVAEKYLPREVIYRKKTGFGAPVREWIINDLQPMIDERLSKEKILSRGLFDPGAISQLIEDNRSGKIDASYTIWSLLAIESWMTQFVDNKPYGSNHNEVFIIEGSEGFKPEPIN